MKMRRLVLQYEVIYDVNKVGDLSRKTVGDIYALYQDGLAFGMVTRTQQTKLTKTEAVTALENEGMQLSGIT